MAQRAPPPPRRSLRLLAPTRTELSRPDPQGLLLTAVYVAFNGFGSECGGLLGTCVELGHDEGDESVLRGVLAWERKAARRGERVRPRLCHAALVGDVARVQRLVRAGAWLMGTEERGYTALIAAVDEQHVDVVRALLACEGADGSFVGARIAAGMANAGHSAFSIACEILCKTGHILPECERAAYAELIHLLVGSGRVSPGDLGGRDASALFWACDAGLVDIVTTLLADARCTAAVMAQRDNAGDSVFHAACLWVSLTKYQGSEDEHASFATIVRLLFATGHVDPGDLVADGSTAFSSACKACLLDVVTSCLAHPRCTPGVIAQHDADGNSAFSLACAQAQGYSIGTDSRFDESEGHADVARLIFASGHVGPGDLGGNQNTALYWACYAGLLDVVTTMLADARCTAAVVAQRGADGKSPFDAVAFRLSDRYTVLSERAAFTAIGRLLAGSGHLSPRDLGRGNGTVLYWACVTGLVDIVTTLLADARCTAAVVAQRSDVGDSPFSVTCCLASQSRSDHPQSEHAAHATIARLLISSGHVGPGDLGSFNATALYWACVAGLVDVVTTLLADARCTAAIVTQRNAHGDSAFSFACADHPEGGEGVRAAYATIARLLIATGHVGPGDLGGSDGTAFASACAAGLPDVVTTMLADPRCTAAIVAQRNEDGGSAFSDATSPLREMSRTRPEGERAAYATIVRLLMSSGHVGPGDLGGSDGTALYWACEAGLPDVVTTLLADPRCTAAVIAQECQDEGRTAFSAACSWASDPERKLTEGERVAYATIVRLLAGSGRVGPGDLDGDGATALKRACEAGLVDVVTLLLADARCTAAIVVQRDEIGDSPFSAACFTGDPEHKGTEAERADYAAIARLLFATGHVKPGDLGGCDATALYWACDAGLPDIVSSWLASPHCKRAVVKAKNYDLGMSAFFAACIRAGDNFDGNKKRVYSVSERAAGAACARALAASPHLSPADTSPFGRTALASACDAGLADIVTTWLADARCTLKVVLQREDGEEEDEDEEGETAASRLLARASFAPLLTPTERRDTAACARALGACAHIPQASREALVAAAAKCEGGGGGGGGAAAQHTG